MLSPLWCAAAPLFLLDPAQPLTRDLQLGLHVTSTHLSAVNPTDAPELLVFVDRDSGNSAHVVVPAHGVFEANFPAWTLTGLELTIVAHGPSGVAVSSGWSLEGLRNRSQDYLWFDLEHEHAHAWARTPHGFELLDAQGNSQDIGPHMSCSPSAPAAQPHVPVVTPDDGSNGDLPPRLRRDPAPPV